MAVSTRLLSLTPSNAIKKKKSMENKQIKQSLSLSAFHSFENSKVPNSQSVMQWPSAHRGT